MLKIVINNKNLNFNKIEIVEESFFTNLLEKRCVMNEKYLHFIWKNKRLPFHRIQTVEGKDIHILDVGIHNHFSGPDFFNGKIGMQGIVHQGNIELHVKSSDWNLHKHQFDDAYRNVILHVVYLHDELIFVEGLPLPTIELKNHIDWKHYNQFTQLQSCISELPCEHAIHEVPPLIVWHQVQDALFCRLERKSQAFPLQSTDIRKTLFHFIAKGFGMKTNELPFEELANRIPFEKFVRASKRTKMALAFGLSGFLDSDPHTEGGFSCDLRAEWDFQRYRLNLTAGRVESWKFKGCRPKGFPTIRLAQFAHFADLFNWSAAFWELPTNELYQLLIRTLTKEPDFPTCSPNRFANPLSIQTAQLILTNSVVPFLWWLSHFLHQSIYREKAIELLEMLPAEKHARLEDWKKMGIVPKSAADSQGLLELHDGFCKQKKCLNCAIGDTILK